MKTEKHGFDFRIIAVVVTLGLALSLAWGKVTKEFPTHWGTPPAIQTQDYVELPADYGHGSSTLAKWITNNLNRDKAAAGGAAPAQPTALYENNFEKAEAGKLPDEFMALAGDFVVKSDGTNQFLELPGSPLDSFAVQFGPTESADVAVAREFLARRRGGVRPPLASVWAGWRVTSCKLRPVRKRWNYSRIRK